MLSLLTNMPKDVLIHQLKDGGIIMLLGMGTVFVFLVVLIYTTKGMSALCRKFAPQKPADPKTTTAPKTSTTTSVNKDSEIAAAIAAAYSKTQQN